MPNKISIIDITASYYSKPRDLTQTVTQINKELERINQED